MNNTLNRAFPIVAAALGNKLGVKVVVGGKDAYTDGGVITLPAYNQDDPAYKDVAWGYLAHEAGHVRFTDFDAGMLAASGRPIRRALHNILEDIRIEKAMMGIYPGTKQTLERLDEYLVLGGHYALATPQDPPGAILCEFIFLRLSTDVLGFRRLAPIADQIESVLEEVFPTGAVTRLFGLLAEANDLASTREALSLTDRILRMIEEEQEKEAEQARSASQNQAQSQSQQASGSEEDTGSAPEHSDPESEGKPEEESLPTGEDQGKSEEDADQTANEPKQAGSGAAGLSPEEVLSALLEAQDSDLPDDIGEIAKNLLTGQSQHNYDSSVRLPSTVRPEHYSSGRQLVQSVMAESGRIRATLQGLVQANSRCHTAYKGHGRKVVGKRLSRLAVGDPRVFEQRTLRQRPNAAVHLLVDFSGSMDDPVSSGKMLVDVALEAALALALALESIPGVNPAITRFPYQETESVVPLMAHGQKVVSCAAHMKGSPDGGSTPLYQALWYAVSALMATKEERKILIVLTDGEPDNPKKAKAVIDRFSTAGIEMIGIGIQHDVSHLFDEAIRIDNVSQLKAKLFDIGKKLLIA